MILFELQEVSRFTKFDNLCGYAGLVLNTEDSGDTKRNKGITNRSNHYLRTALVESSWNVIRKDPALLMLYKKYGRYMNKTRLLYA